MKQLFLVRHAKTETLSYNMSDFDRKLINRGHLDAKLVADDLLSHDYLPDLIISSPAIRAVQTAEIMSTAYQIPRDKIIIAPFLYDGATTDRCLDEITAMANDYGKVMIVGHNPDIAMLAIRLTDKDFINYPTSAVTVISFEISDWVDLEPGNGILDYFIYPQMLK